MSRTALCPESRTAGIDLALIAWRILTVAEIAVLEHLESVDRSQAGGLMATRNGLEEDAGNAERRP